MFDLNEQESKCVDSMFCVLCTTECVNTLFMNLTGMRCAYRTWHAIVSGAKIIFCIMRKNNIFAIEGVARLRGQKSKYVFKVGKFFV